MYNKTTIHDTDSKQLFNGYKVNQQKLLNGFKRMSMDR